ncbi:YrzE family protein [uncultured Bacteroides sp.]|uniref:YrzE family protein n=1 Tax=uncultured Bacteroides sp. TaxID=162156 RepID=UPI0025D2ED0D|nr:YrzE family protein [uncultured Bacteroides sp.]
MRKFNLADLKDRISWGSVFGGVMTVLAISVLLSLLNSSIGLFMFDPLAAHPASGIGTAVGIGSAVILIASMAAGGFVAGKLAGMDGVIHGFLVWATTLIVAAILGIFLAVGAAKVTANALGAVSSVTGNVVSGAGSMVGNGVSALSEQAEELFGKIDFNGGLKDENIPQNIRTALVKSNVKELQPDYLNKQLEEVKDDLGKSVKEIIAAPQEADEAINGFLNRLKQRTETLSRKIDRNDLSKAIANNTNMSKAEADKAVNEYLNMIDNARTEAGKQIDKLEANLQKAAQEWKEVKHKALVAADKATDAAARSALISFFALLAGAVLCCAAGAYGSRKTQERVDI